MTMSETLNTNKCICTAKNHSLTLHISVPPPDLILFYACGFWVTNASLPPSLWLYNNNLQCAEIPASNTPHQGKKKLDTRTCLMYSGVTKCGSSLPSSQSVQAPPRAQGPLKNKSIHARAKLIDHPAKQHVCRVS